MQWGVYYKILFVRTTDLLNILITEIQDTERPGFNRWLNLNCFLVCSFILLVQCFSDNFKMAFI